MRFAFAAVLLFVAYQAVAQQSGVVQFSPPTTGGAVAGYRLYRDNVLVGAVTPGQTVAGLFPANTGTWTFGVEAHNAACGASPLPACTRITTPPITLGPPPLQPPGAVINVVITAPCATANPPTCSINVSGP
jgi:hypothetical protein